MTWKSVGSVLAKLAPTIGAAVGGPLAGTAISAIEGALGVTSSGDLSARQSSIATAIGVATPEQLAALVQADKDFQVKMAQLGFADAEALSALVVQDRESARQREIAVRDWTPRALAIGVTLGFFGLLTFMEVHPVPAESRDVLNILLGSLGSGWLMVLAYYFGSSSENAQQKTAALNTAAKKES